MESVTVEAPEGRLAGSIYWLRAHLGWSYKELGELVNPDGGTLRRWEKGESSPSRKYREDVHNLCDLKHYLEVVFESDEDRLTWLTRYHGELGDRPLDLLESGEFKRVLGELAALDSGAFF